MSSCATLLQMLSAQRAIRREKQLEIPDHDGSKPFMFYIDGKDLQATNRKGANWNQIFIRTKQNFTGDLTQQFTAFKEWLESAPLCSKRSQDQPFLQMLAIERVLRCEKQTDVPDRDGSKPFVSSIDGKDLQASNCRGASWNYILTRTRKYGSKGDLTQNFATFKKWLESDT